MVGTEVSRRKLRWKEKKKRKKHSFSILFFLFLKIEETEIHLVRNILERAHSFINFFFSSFSRVSFFKSFFFSQFKGTFELMFKNYFWREQNKIWKKKNSYITRALPYIFGKYTCLERRWFQFVYEKYNLKFTSQYFFSQSI